MTIIESPRKPRESYSLREEIRAAIRMRIALGLPISYRKIREDVGGGSATTILDEIKKAPKLVGDVLIGPDSNSPADRIRVLEAANAASVAKAAALESENEVLKNLLSASNATLDKLLATHQDSQRMLLQGVDDIRQIARAARVAAPLPEQTATKEVKSPTVDGGDATYWKAKHDELLARYIALDAQNRGLRYKLFELGDDSAL